MLSARDNFLRALGGEAPEYVPRYNLGWAVRPSILNGGRAAVFGTGKDIFGVEWTNEGSALESALPRNDVFILDDIRHWRDVIHFPDFSATDWAALAQKDLKDKDPAQPLGIRVDAQGYFQSVMSFLGFTEGLIACHEDPEEVKAMVHYLCDGYLGVAEPLLAHFKPDYILFADDIAHERSPFLSVECFRDIFAPVWRRHIQFFKERGYLAIHHNCGHFEAYLDDVVDMGFNAWDPAQTSNDLVGIKKKFGNKLMICGGFEGKAFLPHMNATEEQVRGAVKKTMDALAPGGGYAFMGGAGGGDPVSQQRSAWIADEYEKLKATYYN
ncbi:MAG: veratrol--corrinoid protein metyltransferase [Clostridiales bacterium]|nr:veratrol--corrinoid protein metyltransferase [Clostridiales bacterium]